jgi:hypothetical protein
MATTTYSPPAQSIGLVLSHLPAHVRAASSALYWTGMALLLLVPPTFALTLPDSRQFQGVSVWLKPMEFQLSTAVYLLSLASHYNTQAPLLASSG